MGKFSFDMSEFVKKAKGNADLVVRKVVIDLGVSCVRLTPVDTGQAAGNWDYGTDKAPNVKFNVIGASQSIDRINSGVKPDAAGKLHYIVNNLEYIERLENGHSKQAPQGMVGLTLRKFDALVKKAAHEAAKK